MSRLASVLIAAAIATTGGCTTTNYGTKPQPVIGAPADTFRFKIFVGGFSGGDTADAAVVPDLEAFRKANGYASYVIVNRQYNAFPTSYEYFVRFSP